MRRTTARAFAVSATLVLGAGGVATAAVLQLPVLGFGPSGVSATPPPPTAPPPSVVERTIYHDHFVSIPGSGGGGTSRASAPTAHVSAPSAAPRPSRPAPTPIPPATEPADDGEPGGQPGVEPGD
jgi:hypothetical protein